MFWALRDVSFKLAPGEAMGIIGPNGAGKSTLLKLLARILGPDKGRLSIHGRLAAMIEVGAGFHRDLTGRENIFLNGAILGMTRREIRARLSNIVEFAGVEAFVDTPLKRYSSGMQARLGFAVAAHMDPEILLVDEVLAVGDSMFQQRCLERMREFANDGKAIVFISHDLQAVADLCPRTLLLINGRVQADGPTATTIGRYLSCLREATPAYEATDDRIDAVTLATSGRGRFESGKTAHLHVQLAMARAPSSYRLRVGLVRLSDALLVSEYELPLADTIGDTPRTVALQLNCLTGSYAVNAALVDARSGNVLDRREMAVQLDVVDPLAYAGVVHMSPRARVITEPR
jgi:lipopolysaccharide transport system ATP-binding protein